MKLRLKLLLALILLTVNSFLVTPTSVYADEAKAYVTGISKNEVKVGETVTLTGQGFSLEGTTLCYTQDNPERYECPFEAFLVIYEDTNRFGRASYDMPIVSLTETEVTGRIPDIPSGNYQVSLGTLSETSKSYDQIPQKVKVIGQAPTQQPTSIPTTQPTSAPTPTVTRNITPSENERPSSANKANSERNQTSVNQQIKQTGTLKRIILSIVNFFQNLF